MAPSSEAPRDMAEHAANLRAFLHQAVPALAGGFDCERGRLLEPGKKMVSLHFLSPPSRNNGAEMPPVTLLESGERQEPFTDSDYITVWVGD